MLSGYIHGDYAQSLAEYGSPKELPLSGGSIIERRIHAGPDRDAIGTYPLFLCRHWSRLPGDLDELQGESALVSIALVTDPFGRFEVEQLRHCFKDVFIPFKEHFLVDLENAPLARIGSNHRRNVKRALKTVSVERCDRPLQHLDDWVQLYANLARRHEIKGMLNFSRSAFEQQMQVPGIVAFRAQHSESTIGMLLWYQVEEVAYYHLGAFSDTGYELGASFALFWTSIDYFREVGLEWLDLGAGAGVSTNGTDGLTRFKRGWSSHTRPVYFCGRIFAPERYWELTRARASDPTNYFPAYRAGEFS